MKLEWKKMKLEVGKKYRVLKPCKLSKMVSSGNSTWSPENRKLSKGDIIEYVGHKKGIGSDTVPIANFRHEDFEGEFWPNFWGRVKGDYLEAV